MANKLCLVQQLWSALWTWVCDRGWACSAGRLRPFGVRLMAVRRSAWGQAPDQAAEALLDGKGAWGDLPRFAAEADVIIVACSQDASSRGFVNAAFLAACRPGVVIVNVARGACPLPLCQRALHILYNTVTLHNPVGCSEYCDSGRLVVCVHQLRLAQLLRH